LGRGGHRENAIAADTPDGQDAGRVVDPNDLKRSFRAKGHQRIRIQIKDFLLVLGVGIY